MAFTNLTNRLNMALRRFVHKDYLTEADIDEMMREIRLSLLEADVNINVVNSFINDCKQIALGEKIMKGLNPGEQVVKVVYDELTKFMGSAESTLKFNDNGLTVIMMIGLQGAGKTTHSGKIAKYIKDNYNKSVMLAACDIYRPAAIKQLEDVAASINVPLFQKGLSDPVEIAKEAVNKCNSENIEILIIDTAGRLEVDDKLIDELIRMKEVVNPTEVLLTVDSMMGQQAANVSDTFNSKVGITGVVLTKLDGDERGGAALSVKKVTGVPIKFSGIGEHMEDIEVFYPDRMASRILGMGDVLTLIEKAEDAISEEDTERLMEKIQNGTYNYNDLKKQMATINKMGKLSGLLNMIPGLSGLSQLKQINDNDLDFVNIIIDSMTKEERRDPSLIARSSSRKRRIAQGSGRSLTEVNKLEQLLEKQKSTFKMMQNMDMNKLEEQASKLMGSGFNPFNKK